MYVVASVGRTVGPETKQLVTLSLPPPGIEGIGSTAPRPCAWIPEVSEIHGRNPLFEFLKCMRILSPKCSAVFERAYEYVQLLLRPTDLGLEKWPGLDNPLVDPPAVVEIPDQREVEHDTEKGDSEE
jgi:hypothetical protein